MNTPQIQTVGAQIGTKVRALTIEVTQEIIATAVPKQSGHCMISDAVKAAAQKKMRIGRVLTDLQTIRFTDLDSGRKFVCLTPRIGQVALLSFDHGVLPEPFEFKLKPVQVIEKEHRAKKATPDEPGHGPSKPVVAKQKRGTPVLLGGKALAMIQVGQRREFGLNRMGVYPSSSQQPE